MDDDIEDIPTYKLDPYDPRLKMPTAIAIELGLPPVSEIVLSTAELVELAPDRFVCPLDPLGEPMSLLKPEGETTIILNGLECKATMMFCTTPGDSQHLWLSVRPPGKD